MRIKQVAARFKKILDDYPKSEKRMMRPINLPKYKSDIFSRIMKVLCFTMPDITVLIKTLRNPRVIRQQGFTIGI